MRLFAPSVSCSRYPALGNGYSVLGTRYSVLGTRNAAPATHSLLGTRHSMAFLLAAILLALVGRNARADEVLWRRDYNEARREAADKSRPLVLAFSTDNCFWCTKLDTSTLRDPKIVAVMNERFIPLKVNADKSPW